MGQRTDAAIASWQAEHGIEPARGDVLAALNELSAKAVELIKLIELEKSGIRDGNGLWHGSDPVDGVAAAIGAWRHGPVSGPRLGGPRSAFSHRDDPCKVCGGPKGEYLHLRCEAIATGEIPA